MPQSKFCRRLHDVSVGFTPSIGFKAVQAPPPPALLLAVVLPSIEVDLATAAIQAGAEALLVRVSVQDDVAKEMNRLRDVLIAAGDRPCGIVPVGISEHEIENIRQLQTMGFDFVVVSSHDSPKILSLEGLGKVIVVDHTIDTELVRTINELDVDAVEVSLARPENFGKHFSIRDVMHYKLLRMLLRKPIVVRGERSIRPEDISILRDIGVECLVIDGTVTGGDSKAIKDATLTYHEAISKLGPRVRKKRGEMAPVLPQVKPGMGSSVAEPDDEPDDL
ncbi:MAG: hypothetical protein M1343_08025 [Chloroflexi bacterium]|nr:hypothetical protein [Chloroflexota bacterium]